MAETHEPPPRPRAAGLNDLSEDALGFGGRELLTARDVVLRPREVLEAWMTAGATGGGQYARPLRLYLALNAIMMLILFLQGGAAFVLEDLPDSVIQPLVAASGKSRDAFMADADGWMTLVMVPLMSLFYAGAAAPLLRWWDPERLGWRRGFRAAFAYLCAWSVPMLALAWWGFNRDAVGLVVSVAIFILGIVAFMRMGRGRWWVTPAAGLGKALLLSVALYLAGMVAYVPLLAIGLTAGRFG